MRIPRPPFSRKTLPSLGALLSVTALTMLPGITTCHTTCRDAEGNEYDCVQCQVNDDEPCLESLWNLPAGSTCLDEQRPALEDGIECDVDGEGGTCMLGACLPPSAICEARSAEALRVCVADLNDARRACYRDKGSPCSVGDPVLTTPLAVLETAVRASCSEDQAPLSVGAFVSRLQAACRSESASIASRAFGGPHGAVWAAVDPSLAQDCLERPHQIVSTAVDSALRSRNECLARRTCDSAAVASSDLQLADQAIAEVTASCAQLSTIVAVEPEEYVGRTMDQVDCLTATAHTDAASLALSCGPSVVERDPPAAPAANGYMRIVLDSDVYGTRCGGDEPLFSAENPYAFHVKFAPSGHPIDNVLIYLEGGGACMFEDEAPAPGHAGCYSRWLEDPGLFTALDNVPWTNGIMSDDPAISPFANWTKVFLPYCTQDLHMGNGTVSAYSMITVHRYGAINARTALRYVRDLLWHELDAQGGEGFRPDRIKAAFAGFSAGGWGVLYNYHWVLDDLQWPHTAAYPDSALALNNVYDGFWNLRNLSVFVLNGPEPYNWGAQANQPPYCFGPDCVLGPELIQAHSPRLKAVPEQQYMIVSNQNDEYGQMATTFFDRGTTFQQGRVNWINEARSAFCETKDLQGIQYFFMPFSQSLHSTTMTDYYLSQVAVAGQTMNSWMADAFSDPDGVADRTEEGALTSFYPGVNPIPCDF